MVDGRLFFHVLGVGWFEVQEMYINYFLYSISLNCMCAEFIKVEFWGGGGV